MRCAAVTPPTLALLACVRQHQPVGTFALFTVFEGAGEHNDAFRRKLFHLRIAGWLANSGSTYEGIWSLTAKATALLDQPATPPGAEEEEPRPLVPPRQVNVMHGPLYQPVAVPYRAGAFSHEACPSISLGRAVPFKSGQEANHG